jgi:CRISPR-associated endonuclease/helicase Cas3
LRPPSPRRTATSTPTASGDPSSRADAAAKAVARAAATRLFRETIRVGTPYQSLRGALAGPSHSGVLLDTANSVFVLDELHAYDPHRLGFILASARMWEHLGGRVAVLSATLPARLAELFRHALTQPVAEVDSPDLGLPPRHRLSTRSHHLTDPATLDEIRDRLARDESVLVVANNVAHALTLFEELAPAVQDRHGPEAAALLHSRFRRGDRLAIEERVTNRYRTGAARSPGLLVATQVVEVSLNVDFDVLFTAAAPLEALLQRFGRVNRVAARPPADVIVHEPAWTTRRGTNDEFADGVYERAPVEAAWDLLTAHDGTLVDESDATTWLNTIYDTAWGTRWYDDVLAHCDLFRERFLRFEYPFNDRSQLTETFDALFDGTEAILVGDMDAYADALDQGATEAAGRLLADEHLIPMPHWAARLTRWEKKLRVRVIDGDYHPESGLLSVRGEPAQTYRLGELV